MEIKLHLMNDGEIAAMKMVDGLYTCQMCALNSPNKSCHGVLVEHFQTSGVCGDIAAKVVGKPDLYDYEYYWIREEDDEDNQGDPV